MSLEDAANALAWWLVQQPFTVAPGVFGRELGEDHFRLGTVQVAPVPKRRIFEVLPLEVPRCYEVREIES